MEKEPPRIPPYETKSICPECILDGKVNVITAKVYEENGKIMIEKTCPQHGTFKDIYWGSAEQFKRVMKWWYKGLGLENPRTQTQKGCPLDCGLCPNHKTHTALALIDVTNRCVTGDTKVILEDGTITKIENLVNKRIRGRILSWDKDKYQITYESILDWQKIAAPSFLVKIRTRTSEAIFTPDHEILVDTSYGPMLKRADRVKRGDRIYFIGKIPINSSKIDLVDLLADSETEFFIYLKNKEEVKDILKGKYKSYRRASMELGIEYQRIVDSRISFSAKDLKKLRTKGLTGTLDVKCIKYHRNTINVSTLQLTPDLMYLVGLIDSDGCTIRYKYKGGSTNYVAFDNQCKQLLEEFKKIYQRLFPLSKIREEGNRILMNSLVFNEIVRKLSIAADESFQRLFSLDEVLVASYIRGYFDGDGHVSGSEIVFTSGRKERMEKVQYLLKRLGIISNIQKSKHGKSAYGKSKYFYKCKVSGLESKLSFIKLIGSKHPDKMRKLRELSAYLEKHGKPSFPDSSPRHAINEVKNFLYSRKIPIINLRDSSTLYKVAKGIRGYSNEYVESLMKALANGGSPCILNVPSRDFYLDEVIEVKTLKNHKIKYVYDITVKNTHLFVANGGFIVSNCNLRCPICFANAASAGYVYEPTKEEIRKILTNFRNNRPVPAPAVQFAGGEPTVREDLPELIKIAKEVGFPHVEIATNGLRLTDEEYARKLKEAGLSTIYLQFDGVTPKPYEIARGRNLLPEKLKVIEVCRKVGLHSIVLVPTLVRGVNDDQVGKIIEFAVKNYDVIRAVNFQPVSITGRIDREEREKMRITIPDLIKLAEEQTNGRIREEDWYPTSFPIPLSRALGLAKGKPAVEFSTHPACGMATFIIVEENGEYAPITKYIDVERFIGTMEKIANDLEKGGRIDKLKSKLRILGAVRYVKKKSLLKDLIATILKRGDYSSLGEFMRRIIMIGSMHFQDPYNFDLERVERCCIHYGLPDGRIVPFCTMNSIHRPVIERQFAVPIEEWKRQKGKLTEVEATSVTMS